MLTIPVPPQFLKVRKGGKPVAMVEQDLFDVVNRIKEIDPRLYVLFREGDKLPFIVCERTPEGDHVVSRYAELHAGILEDLRFMAAVPFMDRYHALATSIDAENKENDRLGGMDGDQFERFAHGFKRAVRKYGLVH